MKNLTDIFNKFVHKSKVDSSPGRLISKSLKSSGDGVRCFIRKTLLDISWI